MEATRWNLQAQPKMLKKIGRTPKYLKSLKEPKIRMRATRRNLQAQLKVLKKRSEHQIYQFERKCSQKSMFSSLKLKRSQKFERGPPDGICPGSLKNNRSQLKFRKP
jgi:hypothetical protein